jgi:hypothetical protein
VAVVLPCIPETNVGEADATPGEERSKTGKRLEPVEGNGSTSIQGHEGKWRPCEDEDGGPQRSASPVNVREEARSVTLLSKRTQCTRATIDTREADGDHRQHNDDVGEVGESDNASPISNDDEWRGFHIDHTTAQKLRVSVLDKETDKSERQDVEERNAPEHLLNRRGQRPCRVLGLSSSKTDKLSAREGEGGGDEHTAETNKVGECARIAPCSTALVCRVPFNLVSNMRRITDLSVCLLSVGWSTAADEDHTHEKEDDNCRKLQDGNPEFFFGVSHDTEQADNADGEEEHNDPNGDVHILSPFPPLDRKTSDNEFEWKDDSLGNKLVESPRQNRLESFTHWKT